MAPVFWVFLLLLWMCCSPCFARCFILGLEAKPLYIASYRPVGSLATCTHCTSLREHFVLLVIDHKVHHQALYLHRVDSMSLGCMCFR